MPRDSEQFVNKVTNQNEPKWGPPVVTGGFEVSQKVMRIW
ncbi:MAG: hypothetical protein ACD_80C00007G0001, partial [uncultured bacterium (gcode 4)]